jgi:hypothetical protein
VRAWIAPNNLAPPAEAHKSVVPFEVLKRLGALREKARAGSSWLGHSSTNYRRRCTGLLALPTQCRFSV